MMALVLVQMHTQTLTLADFIEIHKYESMRIHGKLVHERYAVY